MKVSVIIPSFNDGNIINNTLESLLTNNTDIHEIIIVDDCSIRDINEHIKVKDKRIKTIRNSKNRGVGFSFDVGADASTGDVLYLMGSDIRFDNNNAISLMSKCAVDNPKSLVGCECVGVSNELEFKSINASKYATMQDDMLGKRHRLLGSTLLWKMSYKDLSDLNPHRIDYTYRDILQAKWQRHEGDVESLAQTPCLHGATYAVKKDWYTHIMGFESHRIWGGLEPMISIKSYLAGGDCLVMGDVYTGHIFGRGVSRPSNMDAKYFNKVYMAYLYFDKELTDDLLEHVLVWKPPFRAKKEILENWRSIYLPQREYYDSIFIKDVRDTLLWDTWV